MKQKNDKVFVGLTGGIGSGKTTAAKHFYALGAKVLDADEISRNALSHNGSCVKKTVEAFGSSILNSDGSVNRKALADEIFGDEEKRLKLNGIIHPYVIHELLKKAYSSDRRIIIFDVPLLFECGLDALMDHIITVHVDREKRISRVISRDRQPEDEVIKRIQSQLFNEKRFNEADFTINNNGSIDEIILQVDQIYRQLSDN